LVTTFGLNSPICVEIFKLCQESTRNGAEFHRFSGGTGVSTVMDSSRRLFFRPKSASASSV
jgi:hypothetical protein